MTAESAEKASGAKRKALCVGINNYGSLRNNLKGCINDAEAWAQVLSQNYDFPQSDIVILRDAEATKLNMLNGLKSLMAGAKAGDVLVFTNSSHGSYVAEKNGDEPKYDEILCPYDIMSNHIVDDELRELFANLPKDVNLTLVLDNCHSGSGSRMFPTPDDRRSRFLDPSERNLPTLDDLKIEKPESDTKYPESGMNEILLSGCSDIQSSYDAMIGGKYHGAMTYYALQAIREANYDLTYSQLHQALKSLISDYPQNPQLEGKDENKERRIFS